MTDFRSEFPDPLEPNIWKIAFPETSGDLSTQNTVNSLHYCLSRGIVAVAQTASSQPVWSDEALFQEFRHYPSELYAIFSRVRENDLVWTRNSLGIYYLGRVLVAPGPDFSSGQPAPSFLSVPCRWFQAGTVDAVCRSVSAAFEPYRQFRLIASGLASLYSRLMYNSLKDDWQYPLPGYEGHSPFQLFSLEDLLDILALYLQFHVGCRLVPSSFSRETGVLDFTFPAEKEGGFGGVKIYGGQEEPDLDTFMNFPGQVYVFAPFHFQSRKPHAGFLPSNVRILYPDALERFLLEHIPMLTPRLKLWIRYYFGGGVQ